MLLDDFPDSAIPRKPNVLMIGTGEYTTGYVGDGSSLAKSDKGAGVVALTMLDLRKRHKIGPRLGLCGVNGTKFPGIRKHMQAMIGDVYDGLLDDNCEFGGVDKLETFPGDTEINPQAYLTALQTFEKGDIAIIFTPDDTHFDIAKACMEHGLHVMVTKPMVHTLEQHHILKQLADERNVLVAMEVHKRLDPFYADARDRARTQLGAHFQYLYAYMSQPKHQLATFQAWAGKSSDISYYLNSHHIDWTEWTLHGLARPVRVTATASTGIARNVGKLPANTEDSITLTVQWENLTQNDNDTTNPLPLGTAVYTSSWVAPPSDVHSQQRFFYMGSRGEITVDQAHRGCTVSMDNTVDTSMTGGSGGVRSINPLFIKYTPGNGRTFAGQATYGYQSLAQFCAAARQVVNNVSTVASLRHQLATVQTTLQGTAILQAGRQSLDNDGRPVDIVYASAKNDTNDDDDSHLVPTHVELHRFADEK